MINFYRRFLGNATQVLAPLTNDLKSPGKSLQWSPALDSVFHDVKLLTSVPILTHPVLRAAISLAVDASDSHLGDVLGHPDSSTILPISLSLPAILSTSLALRMLLLTPFPALPVLSSNVSVLYTITLNLSAPVSNFLPCLPYSLPVPPSSQ